MNKDAFIMPDGTVLLNVHTSDQCAGQVCCIHNPTRHHMRHWPPVWDDMFAQMWHKCPHDMEHPNPDDLLFWRRKFGELEAAASWLHSCDGCCQPQGMLPEKIREEAAAIDEAAFSREGKWELVPHVPVWEPAQLRYNAAGDTKPGFVCTHILENGTGMCGGNVFTLDQAVSDHSCWVLRP